MRILVHYPSLKDAPQGVWWDAPTGFESFYEPGSSLRKIGRMTFSTMLPDVAFEDVCDALEEDNGYFDVWTTMEVPDGTEPAQALKLAKLAQTA